MRFFIIFLLFYPWLAVASSLPTLTAKDLAVYDGKKGHKAYVALNGYVYDVSSVRAWRNGTHGGYPAGVDLTPHIEQSPHGASVIKDLGLTPIALYSPE